MLVGGGGVRQAFEMLGAHPDDWLFYCAITERAGKLRNDRDRALVESVAAASGNRLGEVVVKALSRMFG